MRLQRITLGLVAVVVVAACTGESTPPSTTGAGATPPSSPASTTSTSSVALPACMPGAPRVGIDLEYERFFDAYRHSQTDRLIELIGDGPVFDPWLDPNHEGEFADLDSWVTAGNDVTDRFANFGYGMGEPFRIFSSRKNEILEAHGIDELTVTLDLWVNQVCELRIEVHSPVASPDPCVLDDVFVDRGLAICMGPFRPISDHHSVWTGDEVFVFGGTSGGLNWLVRPEGSLFDPATGQTRPVAPPPVDEGWYVHDVVWVEGRALVVGQSLYRGENTDYRPSIVAFDPESDTWTDLTVFPEERQLVGAVVSTGTHLMFVGGDLNGPSDQVWVYSLDTDRWRHLEDAPIPPVEEARAVWTGTEVVVVGGYAGVDQSLYMAYDPARDDWRELPNPGHQYIEYHDLYWTGEKVIVAPMHVYNEDRGVHNSLTLLLYDPSTDVWAESSENPAQPPIRGAVTWTGSDLLSWGGFSSTWHATSEGSAYDPVTDTWRLLAETPLSARSDHTGTWTGDRWVIIGGSTDGGTPGSPSLSDGAIYDPTTDIWEYLGG